MSYRVLIAEDQAMPRMVFENIIGTSENYTLTASVGTAKIADVWCASGKVDLVLMDVVMEDGYSGLDAAERIKRSYPGIKVIIVTSMPDQLFLERARAIGVDSFWYKEIQERPLLELMDRTMAGEHIYPDRPPEAFIGDATNYQLTDREIDFLRALAEGLTDKEIADRLFLSVTTVRYHVNNLITKTGLPTRTSLAVNAVRSGIAIPGV
ncbi:MAG: response regulator transcription factor [Firmicutes bacterium]|nr:response regulator transcription factor [Bacillota bacterium]